ncbi:hypothetical protein FRC12_004603 [Ceratobasidium sp. 428]|nr:hypothetical protein FRC12_004603 [Ceratobasidium sp. 428]
MLRVAWDNKRLIENLIHYMNLRHEHLNQATFSSMLQLLSIHPNAPILNLSMIRRWGVSTGGLIDLISLLSKWTNQAPQVQRILADIQDLARVDLNDHSRTAPKDCYILVFTSQVEGFRSLVSLSQVHEYTSITVECIKAVVHTAAVDLPAACSVCAGINSSIVPGLLDCAAVVLDNTTQETHILTFIVDVITLIDTAGADGSIIAANHSAMNKIQAVLSEPYEPNESRIADIITILQQIQARADPDRRLLQGVRPQLEPDSEQGKCRSVISIKPVDSAYQLTRSW